MNGLCTVHDQRRLENPNFRPKTASVPPLSMFGSLTPPEFPLAQHLRTLEWFASAVLFVISRFVPEHVPKRLGRSDRLEVSAFQGCILAASGYH